MTRQLLHRLTNQLQPYPRDDDQPVVGLDRAVYHVLAVERIQQPTDYDPTAYALSAVEPIIEITDPNGNDLNGTVTYGWQLTMIEPPPPPEHGPDWLGFAGWLYGYGPMAEAMTAARASMDPQGEPATTGLPAAMEEARKHQNYVAFALTWGQFLGASQMPAASIAEIAAKAEACNLPAEFIAALQPMRRRARNEDGTWRADDPSTPDVDEAWEPLP